LKVFLIIFWGLTTAGVVARETERGRGRGREKDSERKREHTTPDGMRASRAPLQAFAFGVQGVGFTV